MSAPGLDPAVIAEWTRRSRASQGLSERIPAGAVLSNVITLTFAGTGPPTSDSGPAVGHRAAQPSAAAKQSKGRVQYATGQLRQAGRQAPTVE
jgi:hypothetical protein